MLVKNLLFLLLLLVIIPSSLAQDSQFGSFQPIVKSVEVDLTLNEDGSVDSSITLKSLSPLDLESDNHTIMSGIVISDNELIDPKSIKIIDQHNPSIEFLPTANLNIESCLNKYYFDLENNDIQFCVLSTSDDDLYYTINYKYEALDYPQREICSDRGIVKRPLNFSFSHQPNPYYASFSLSTVDSLEVNRTLKCPDSWTKTHLNNGFKCINKKFSLQDPNKVYVLDTTLSAVEKSYLVHKDEENKDLDVESKIIRSQIITIVDKILMLILGIITFVPSINKKFKMKITNTLKNKNHKWCLIGGIIFLIISYLFLQIWGYSII